MPFSHPNAFTLEFASDSLLFISINLAGMNRQMNVVLLEAQQRQFFLFKGHRLLLVLSLASVFLELLPCDTQELAIPT